MALAKRYDGTQWVDAAEWKVGGEIREGLVRVGGEWIPFTRKTIDDFEHDDIPTFYNGATDNWTTTLDSSLAVRGSYVAENSGSQGSYNALWSLPGDGLENYPIRGDTITGHTYISQENDRAGLHYALQDDTTGSFPSGYRAEIRGDEDAAIIWFRWVPGGQDVRMSEVSFSLAGHTQEWLRHEVKFGADSPNEQVYSCYDESDSLLFSFTADDSVEDEQWDSGGVGPVAGLNSTLAEERYQYHDDYWLI